MRRQKNDCAAADRAYFGAMKPIHRNRRLGLIAAGAVLLGGAAFLVFKALERNIALFYTPSEAAEAGVAPATQIRLGGLVETGSVSDKEIAARRVETQFRVTDGAHTVTVVYVGILPDLFREGQGVIAQGSFDSAGRFHADTILAKHDENYVPKELEGMMEQVGS